MWRKHLDEYYDSEEEEVEYDGRGKEYESNESEEEKEEEEKDVYVPREYRDYSITNSSANRGSRGGSRATRSGSRITRKELDRCIASFTMKRPFDVSGAETSVPANPVASSRQPAATSLNKPEVLSSPAKRLPSSKSKPPASARPPCMSLVVAGHVDSGKSTLTGHLLYKMGATTAAETSSLRRCIEGRKDKFFFAWLLDGGVDERQRGVTIDVTVKTFSTPSRRFCLLDTPGHTEFVPNMILGAAQADAAILVVDAKGFDAGFCKGGETKQHMRLISGLGISQMIVALNKMDLIAWDEAEFRNLITRIDEYITKSGEVSFHSCNVTYVPLAALSGINIVPDEETSADVPAWVKNGPSLLSAMDSLNVAESSASRIDEPLCLSVSETFEWRGVPVLGGKVISGSIQEGDHLLVLPGELPATVKNLHVTEFEKVSRFEAGEYASIVQLDKVTATQLYRGSVLVSQSNSKVVVCTEVYASMSLFLLSEVLIPGSPVMAHIGTAVEAAFVKTIVFRRSPTPQSFGVSSDRQLADGVLRPKLLRSHESGVILLTLERPLCCQYFVSSSSSQASPLCRIILRYEGRTIGAGVILNPEQLEALTS